MGLAVGTAKYLLFFFNFIFFITGIVIIAIGAVVLKDVNDYQGHIDAGVGGAPVLLIVVGVFVMVISFFGCCGAIKHNYCMLMTFAALLTLIFILELAAGIAAYVKKDALAEEVSKGLSESLKKYKDYEKGDNSTKEFWDNLQEKEKCCGVHNVTDWGFLETKMVPKSCCNTTKVKVENCDALLSTDNKDIYQTGCADWLEDFFKRNIVTIGGLGVGIAFVQILGIVFACCLASAVKDSH